MGRGKGVGLLGFSVGIQTSTPHIEPSLLMEKYFILISTTVTATIDTNKKCKQFN